jgi:hypothetical protein
MSAAQRTAWDTYLTLTRGLLPALDDDQIDAATLDSQLGGVAIRLLRYAPLRGEHGPMLLAVLQVAVRLHRGGDRADLADLLQALANRLYLLAADPRLPHGGGHDQRPPQPRAPHEYPDAEGIHDE